MIGRPVVSVGGEGPAFLVGTASSQKSTRRGEEWSLRAPPLGMLYRLAFRLVDRLAFFLGERLALFRLAFFFAAILGGSSKNGAQN
jgi:hypothetical protein